VVIENRGSQNVFSVLTWVVDIDDLSQSKARDNIYQYPATHVKTQNAFILASMNYFDSAMSKSTNTVVRFVNKRAIYRLVIISLAHAHVTDFPVVNEHLDELSSARIWQHKFSLKMGIYIYVCGICRTQFTVFDFSGGPVSHGQ
jgi:hypothetical protein